MKLSQLKDRLLINSWQIKMTKEGKNTKSITYYTTLKKIEAQSTIHQTETEHQLQDSKWLITEGQVQFVWIEVETHRLLIFQSQVVIDLQH